MLAFIIPIETGGTPTHPIAPGGPPLGIWGGAPSFPAHPIAPGGGGLGIWGGGVPMPTPPIYLPVLPPADSGLSPEHPIYFPVYPSHPIANVPTWEDIKNFIFGNVPARPHPETP
jgi:hypothetical protein